MRFRDFVYSVQRYSEVFPIDDPIRSILRDAYDCTPSNMQESTAKLYGQLVGESIKVGRKRQNKEIGLLLERILSDVCKSKKV